ncbi:MAG TPA: WGR domain-containing protein [Tepidisphaeraceae bacterium]|jgi:poly [ADP-ribose] polymerase|nr:WGR domain-containing protein [Tepidisphaeraceae bacterium]
MAKVKAWKHGESGEPGFSSDFGIVQKAVLQVTDIKTNRNKYYAIELHSHGAENGVASKGPFRVFTHYGRTDDLERDPDAGQKECRYFNSLPEAQGCYQQIYREKTSTAKGYKELSLASSKIGSQRARGTSAGEVDAKTIERLAKAKAEAAAKNGKPIEEPKRLDLHAGVQDIVRYIYAEATNALTSTVAAKITANGIETPLGVLTIGQIEKGEAILTEMYGVFQKKPRTMAQQLEDLSGEFYTVVPHRIGRTRDAIAAAVINTSEAFGQKQETLQLMKDMLQVNGEEGSVLYDAQIDAQYLSLKADLHYLDRESPTFRQIADHVVDSQVKTKGIKVQNIFGVKRPGEWDDFRSDIDNQRLMFHGSRIQNWVGILSRGILMPKIVVNLGVHRTDAGWLGHGIYFGDASCTSCFYTTPGKKKTRLMAVTRVALGKMKDYTKITYGLDGPPDGYHSCHGVRNNGKNGSQFADDEYVIYDPKQHRQEYLVEFTA